MYMGLGIVRSGRTLQSQDVTARCGQITGQRGGTPKRGQEVLKAGD